MPKSPSVFDWSRSDRFSLIEMSHANSPIGVFCGSDAYMLAISRCLNNTLIIELLPLPVPPGAYMW